MVNNTEYRWITNQAGQNNTSPESLFYLALFTEFSEYTKEININDNFYVEAYVENGTPSDCQQMGGSAIRITTKVYDKRYTVPVYTLVQVKGVSIKEPRKFSSAIDYLHSLYEEELLAVLPFKGTTTAFTKKEEGIDGKPFFKYAGDTKMHEALSRASEIALKTMRGETFNLE